MAGAIMRSVAISIFNSYCTPPLSQYMSQNGMTRDMIYSPSGITKLSDPDQALVSAFLGGRFNRQVFVLSAFAAAHISASLLLCRKEQIRV